MGMILTCNSKGFVSVCGVRIGMTRKQTKETLMANGFEPAENQRCVYIKDVVFEKDLPPANNVTFGIDEAYRVSHIRIITNMSNKEMAIRFYQCIFSKISMFGLTIDYEDKHTEEGNNQSTLFVNPVNRVHLFCSYIRNSTGDIDRSHLCNIVTISSYIYFNSDAKSIKEKYYKLLENMSTIQICKPQEKKSKIRSFYENNKGTILVAVCFGWSILCGAGIFLYDRCSKSVSTTETNSLYSSEPSTGKPNAVYICTGPNAKKYHSTPSCRWLENCSGDIKEVSLSYAEGQDRTPCKGCY